MLGTFCVLTAATLGTSKETVFLKLSLFLIIWIRSRSPDAYYFIWCEQCVKTSFGVLFFDCTQIAKTIGLTSIIHRSDIIASDRFLIHIVLSGYWRDYTSSMFPSLAILDAALVQIMAWHRPDAMIRGRHCDLKCQQNVPPPPPPPPPPLDKMAAISQTKSSDAVFVNTVCS